MSPLTLMYCTMVAVMYGFFHINRKGKDKQIFFWLFGLVLVFFTFLPVNLTNSALAMQNTLIHCDMVNVRKLNRSQYHLTLFSFF